ncbi:WD40-repeat-containing domain protein [Crassisporium funariophilum]|nr:WD40-repeat-containing domain protein [Crassisporium funariophilum]
MRFRTLEIRWHDSKPISTCDFQPVSYKKARPGVGQEKNYTTQAYRLATGGEDNHVRIWMVHPHIRPPNVVGEEATGAAPRPPRVEYLATLSRHSAAVNVVRFSPNGELIASAGDDGMIIIWAPSSSPQASTYGSDLSPEDLQHEKEYWKPRTTFRCTTMQVYDLAWSPTGEYLIAGSTDNTARVFAAADGKCVYEIAEHSHYVQGVAWDPLNEYIATQSSDRSMHVYRISSKPGGAFEAHAVGKNTRMPHSHSRRHSRTPSAHGGQGSRPRMFRRESTASDIDSISVVDWGKEVEDSQSSASGYGGKEAATPLTPATSVGSTPAAFMFPPPPIEGSSRRSSFSGASNPPGPGSPSTFSSNSRYGRSPSPMPPLPAIRSLPSPSTSNAVLSWANVKLYGDESWTNFFRRLTFSPDGGLLLTPAGQFEDPSVVPGISSPVKAGGGFDDNSNGTPMRGRKGHPSTVSAATLTGGDTFASSSSTTSSVYIYSRANFARPPIAQLPGHKKASVAVRFSPVLYDLRPGVASAVKSGDNEQHRHHEGEIKTPHHTPNAVLEKGVDGRIDVDVVGPLSGPTDQAASIGGLGSSSNSLLTPQRTPAHSHSHSNSGSQLLGHSIATPTPRPAIFTSGINPSAMRASSPMLSPMDMRPPTPAASKPSTPVPPSLAHAHSQTQGGGGPGPIAPTASIFALPYRMLFAVVTMDTVAIYDTQQAGPVCLLTKLHYDEFTDLTWSPDGQCLILSSRDGYCTLIVFDEILPAYHTQQHTLQLQSIAHHHSVPLSYSNSSSQSSANNHAGVSKHHHSDSSASASASTQATPAATPSFGNVNLPPFMLATPTAGTSATTSTSKKRSEPPLTPAASVDGSEQASYFSSMSSMASASTATTSVRGGESQQQQQETTDSADKIQEPPKKKRRVALTRVGDLEL